MGKKGRGTKKAAAPAPAAGHVLDGISAALFLPANQYGAPPKALTADQQAAIIDTQAEIAIARSDLELAIADMSARVEAAREAKKKRDAADKVVEALRDRLEQIAAGQPLTPIVEAQRLPGQGDAEKCIDCGGPIGENGTHCETCRAPLCENCEEDDEKGTPRCKKCAAVAAGGEAQKLLGVSDDCAKCINQTAKPGYQDWEGHHCRNYHEAEASEPKRGRGGRGGRGGRKGAGKKAAP